MDLSGLWRYALDSGAIPFVAAVSERRHPRMNFPELIRAVLTTLMISGITAGATAYTTIAVMGERVAVLDKRLDEVRAAVLASQLEIVKVQLEQARSAPLNNWVESQMNHELTERRR